MFRRPFLQSEYQDQFFDIISREIKNNEPQTKYYEYFSFSFIFTIIYLEVLLIDWELLSAFIISEQAIQIEQKTRDNIDLIQRMKTEHYRQYETFLEKIKTYLKLN